MGSENGCLAFNDVAKRKGAMNKPPRCLNSGHCPEGSDVCIWPDPAHPIIRVFVSQHNSSAILFGGSRASLYAQVSVTLLRPRFFWVPSSQHIDVFLELVHILTKHSFLLTTDSLTAATCRCCLSNFYRYTVSICLGFMFFNSLPLPHLDGTQILASTFEALQEDSSTPFGSPSFLTTLFHRARPTRAAARASGIWLHHQRKIQVLTGLWVTYVVLSSFWSALKGS